MKPKQGRSGKPIKNAEEAKTESLWVDGIKAFFCLSTENLSDGRRHPYGPFTFGPGAP
jgi:hypothetical protein